MPIQVNFNLIDLFAVAGNSSGSKKFFNVDI